MGTVVLSPNTRKQDAANATAFSLWAAAAAAASPSGLQHSGEDDDDACLINFEAISLTSGSPQGAGCAVPRSNSVGLFAASTTIESVSVTAIPPYAPALAQHTGCANGTTAVLYTCAIDENKVS